MSKICASSNIALVLFVFVANSLYGQPQSPTVPFVGCPSDGQVGPIEPPSGAPMTVQLGSRVAELLAYYKPERGPGVLAPRDWHCFGVVGSSGYDLFIAPVAIEPRKLFGKTPEGFAGPIVAVSYKHGESSGGFQVADIVARVFPAYRQFALEQARTFDQPLSSIPNGPFPNDNLIYRGKRIVEYRTPGGTQGLGTRYAITANENPIDGVAILVGPTPDLVILSVRLPADRQQLSSGIIRELERTTRDP